MKLVLRFAVLLIAVTALSGCIYGPGYGYVRGDGYYGDAYYGNAYSAPYYYGGYSGYSPGYYGYYGYGPSLGLGIYYDGYSHGYRGRGGYYNHSGGGWSGHGSSRGRGGGHATPPIRPSDGPRPQPGSRSGH